MIYRHRETLNPSFFTQNEAHSEHTNIATSVGRELSGDQWGNRLAKRNVYAENGTELYLRTCERDYVSVPEDACCDWSLQ